jgi:PhnB protein
MCQFLQSLRPPAAHDRLMTAIRMYPRLVVSDARAAIDFYVAVFGATCGAVFSGDSGEIHHAEVSFEGAGIVGIKDQGDGDEPVSVIMALEVTNPDEVAAAMEAGGATVIYPISDHEYGRGGRLRDPWGIQWMLMRP